MFAFSHGLAVLLLLSRAPTGARAQEGRRSPAGDMVRVPAGSYRPLYGASSAARVHVAAFAVDRRLVTRADYARFLDAHPEWRRGDVASARAESTYLGDWASLAPNAPVTDVSWYAASAYCADRGARLPTTAEWEYLAAASERSRDATGDPRFLARLTAMYGAHPRTGFTNVYGVAEMHGPVWEWTSDFDGAPADDTHAAPMPGMAMSGAGGHSLCAGAALGATDVADYAAFLRAAVRASLTRRSAVDAVGFRCAAGASGGASGDG